LYINRKQGKQLKEQQHAKDILRRYLNGQCTEEERIWVEEWYREHYDTEFKIDSNLAEEHLADVWQVLDSEVHRKKIWTFRKIAVAAASVILLVGMGLLYVNKSTKPSTDHIAHVPEETLIQAGRDQALLTFADGRTIHLDSIAIGDHLSENGITIAKMDDGTLTYAIKEAPGHTAEKIYNTISTPRGGQYKVILPDNSVVWLNAASSLRFPIAFTGDTREVELVGEGYFEVAHHKQKPFIVTSTDQQTIVKGTKFNITSYPDDIKKTTTLLEGSVLVKKTSDMGHDDLLLRPNEQVVLQHNRFAKSRVNAADAISWKNGKFMFNDTPLKNIMQQLARWYDVEIVYLESTEGITFTGSISRFDDIQDVLRKISLTESVQFETKERRIMVRR